jgi:hypothetical protein
MKHGFNDCIASERCCWIPIPSLHLISIICLFLSDCIAGFPQDSEQEREGPCCFGMVVHIERWGYLRIDE